MDVNEGALMSLKGLTVNEWMMNVMCQHCGLAVSVGVQPAQLAHSELRRVG